MNKLRYKGYVGSVEVSEEDNCLYGHVLDLPRETEITFEGGTVAQLKEDFMNAVDDYIAYCESKGVHPCKSCKGALNIRISPDAYTKIAQIAAQAGISINAFVRQAIDKQIAAML